MLALAGLRSRSPVCTSPPPITTSSGSNTVTSEPIPTPSQKPSRSNSSMAVASPRWAARKTSSPVTFSGSPASCASSPPGSASAARRPADAPARPVDQPGRADADRLDGWVALAQLLDHATHGRDGGGLVAHGRGHQRALLDPALGGDHARGDLGAADVDADRPPDPRVRRQHGIAARRRVVFQVSFHRLRQLTPVLGQKRSTAPTPPTVSSAESGTTTTVAPWRMASSSVGSTTSSSASVAVPQDGHSSARESCPQPGQLAPGDVMLAAASTVASRRSRNASITGPSPAATVGDPACSVTRRTSSALRAVARLAATSASVWDSSSGLAPTGRRSSATTRSASSDRRQPARSLTALSGPASTSSSPSTPRNAW